MATLPGPVKVLAEGAVEATNQIKLLPLDDPRSEEGKAQDP
jgi:hypothetical protein